ncbi:23S rRNA (uracil(1939)-C(5))-methyltransferase RlmD|uniref:23S rRNA (Uracil1939-C5)-methyltransferase n=1 Tax=Dendrosporobacter quercicolus TaxID=146817 RepID=A0A1G9NTF4_9FIRM|nr:23S rRNA (uracil(1939)-C(5))-methyltransferase RlmD [Dendrosporobacter quercicolus]NSL47447.1 23S rRNA (uracil(1939)-C(5))-methyltransferase RlmD [Dendrosporobacter quercicolus DSM 1736]SDL89868.1 23S rRNA (uracil1939-C5)-methyltransferase [Dendrosporobacter quercicolus]
MTREIPVIKGQTYCLNIVSLGHSGEGVGRYRDFTVFVPGALPGEEVKVKIIECKKSYAKGQLIAVKHSAAERVQPHCGLYRQCGGCQLQHLDYPAQLSAKRQLVVDAVTRIGKIAGVTVKPTLGAANPWYYRNKMQFPVGMDQQEIVIGCFAQGTHAIVNTEHCLIQHQSNNLIARQVRRLLGELEISIYDEKTGAGAVRHVLGRVGAVSGEVMVVLVTACDTLPNKNALVAGLRDNIPGLVSIVQNVNSKKTNVIMGSKTVTLWGQDTITDKLGPFTFHISARSFFQVNTAQAEILYNTAVEYAALTGRETVIDAYCGTGTISLFLARQARRVIGIEIVEPAIRDAWRNAELNGIDNAEFIVGDAVAVMPELYTQGVRPDVIVVDPPRAGCDRPVLEAFAHMQPQRIVYVSCNPASLARDLAVLTEYDYEVREIQPVDMFPHTYHVETVTLLQRKDTTI